jgi:hypothetical protein
MAKARRLHDEDLAEDTPREDRREDRTERNVATGEALQRQEFGGFHFGAAFFGWLVATGLGVLLTSFLVAAGSAVALSAVKNAAGAVQQNGDTASTVGIASGVLLLIVLAISYYAGGYVAGRMSRFDGGRQGFGVWVMGLVIALLLAAAGAVFGAKYNLLQQVNLPTIPVDQGDLTSGGLITLVATLVVTFVAAVSGGKTGERYHRKIDRAGDTV